MVSRTRTLRHSLKKKAEHVLESIEEFAIADEQKNRIRIVREHYDVIEKLIVKVDTYVNEMIEKYEVRSIFFAPFRVLTVILQSRSFLKSAQIWTYLVPPSGFAAWQG